MFLSGAPAPAVAADDGCSVPGCLFGTPIPIPSAILTTCLLVSLSGDVSGKLTCNGSDWQVEPLQMPLSAEIFRNKTSNTPGDPAEACPRCTGKTHDTCSENGVELIATLELPSLAFTTRKSTLLLLTILPPVDRATL